MVLKGLILLALLAASPTFATTIILTQVDSTLGENIAFYDYGTNATNWAGGVDATVEGYSRVLYCVQLTVNINVPGTYNSVLDFADTASLQRVGWLMQYQAPTTPATGAGFQLALWDILQDGGDGFSKGNVRAATSGTATPQNVLDAANNYETISVGKSSTAAILYNNFLSGVPQQELIGFWATDGGPTPAPEPAAMFLMIGGLALIAVGRLRLGRRG
jgi:hypothetical protein